MFWSSNNDNITSFLSNPLILRYSASINKTHICLLKAKLCFYWICFYRNAYGYKFIGTNGTVKRLSIPNFCLYWGKLYYCIIHDWEECEDKRRIELLFYWFSNKIIQSKRYVKWSEENIMSLMFVMAYVWTEMRAHIGAGLGFIATDGNHWNVVAVRDVNLSLQRSLDCRLKHSLNFRIFNQSFV